MCFLVDTCSKNPNNQTKITMQEYKTSPSVQKLCRCVSTSWWNVTSGWHLGAANTTKKQNRGLSLIPRSCHSIMFQSNYHATDEFIQSSIQLWTKYQQVPFTIIEFEARLTQQDTYLNRKQFCRVQVLLKQLATRVSTKLKTEVFADIEMHRTLRGIPAISNQIPPVNTTTTQPSYERLRVPVRTQDWESSTLADILDDSQRECVSWTRKTKNKQCDFNTDQRFKYYFDVRAQVKTEETRELLLPSDTSNLIKQCKYQKCQRSSLTVDGFYISNTASTYYDDSERPIKQCYTLEVEVGQSPTLSAQQIVDCISLVHSFNIALS
jgi:hypothetical protein